MSGAVETVALLEAPAPRHASVTNARFKTRPRFREPGFRDPARYGCRVTTLGFLATLLGGGVLGVLLRAGHERTERSRDRLLDTAERFLAAQEVARTTFAIYRQRTSYGVTRFLVSSLLVFALHPFASSIRPLPAPVRADVGHSWHAGCPVPLSGLRVLTVSYWGFDGSAHTGQLVVRARAAASLATVFGRLYAMRFPIHHMQLSDAYGPGSGPVDGDVTASFECRQAVPSPCTGGTGTGSWSEHAFGEAVDLNPVENPYVGCGMTRDKSALAYLDRSRVRRGMVTPAVIAAFRSVGWGWGGSWSGSTKDYMHFSATGH